MTPFIKALLVLVLVLAVTGGTVAYSTASKGLSTRTSPSMAEEFTSFAACRTYPSQPSRGWKGLNPQSPAKLREAEEARLFLEGMTEAPKNSTTAKPHHD